MNEEMIACVHLGQLKYSQELQESRNSLKSNLQQFQYCFNVKKNLLRQLRRLLYYLYYALSLFLINFWFLIFFCSILFLNLQKQSFIFFAFYNWLHYSTTFFHPLSLSFCLSISLFSLTSHLSRSPSLSFRRPQK